MDRKGFFALLVPLLFVLSGCLENLEQKDDGFWGDDCEEVADEICTSGPAPDFELVDQFGQPVNMSQFRGKIVVMTFVFTNCTLTCPAVTSNMKHLARELGDDYNESVVFLSVTVDPERDTPERLADFAESSNASWQFLTSDSNAPVGHMSSVWQDYGVYVNIDEDACGGNGMTHDGYEGCHCNPGYLQDPWNVDSCIEDPDYDRNATFEEGTLEDDILTALDMWASGNVDASELMNGTIILGQPVPGIRELISQRISQDWKLDDMNGMEHSSSTYYAQNLTLLEFFHTDCPYCHSQIPALKEFHANHSSNVSIISIGGYSMSGNLNNVSNVENFTIEHNTTWTYLYDDSHSLMRSFGLGGYPSWVLLDGDQVVGRETGPLTYEELESFVESRSERVNLSEQMIDILEELNHWDVGHYYDFYHSEGDQKMVEVIANALNYEYEEEPEENTNYGVSHSAKLYIIDQQGNMRVLWRGYEWTWASVYHDVAMLL